MTYEVVQKKMPNFYENNLKECNGTSTTTSPFYTNQVFKSREELMEWVQSTAFSLGYIIVTRRSKAKENGMVSYVTLVCDRGGEYKSRESSKKTGTKKINCKFQLVGSYLTRYDGWTLRVICDQHNHSPAQHMEGHAYARRLKESEQKLLADLTSKNVTPRDILSTLKEQDENNVSTQKTIYNARQKLRLSQNVGKTPIQVLMLLLNDRHFLTEFSVNNVTNDLENIFFIHPRSLDMWRAFPHVLIVDATYKTNKYDMPFVQMVGVTSTNKTFSIAFAFIINEKEENYTWALTCLKLTLEECMHPRVIVTDRELALMNACQLVFPNATRLLCRWHIAENIKKHCRQSIKSQHEWDSFRAMWTLLVESPTLILYTENYKKLQSMLNEYPGECIPLDSIDVFWRKLDLSPLTFEENEDIYCDHELEMFKENFTKQSKVGKKSLLRKLRDIFLPSTTLIKEPKIQKNTRGRPILKKQHQKHVDSISQAPRRRSYSAMSKFVGLDVMHFNKEPARHSSYITEIPDLNQEPSEQVSNFIDLNQMHQSCDTNPLMKEISDIFHPYITHIQDVRGDGNCGFRAISVCLGYGEDQWLYVRHQLLDELLSSYDDYARVFTDGIDELRNSLCFSQSPAPVEHWMVMPTTGILIANRFGVILNYLTTRGEMTFFPLWRGPEQFQYHQAITISHVHGKHYVAVHLEGEYPMPTISAYWIHHRAPSAAGWQTMYISRLEFYRQLKPCNFERHFITIEDYS